MARFFLSYRREDSAGFAGRLADDLEARFGAGSVFRDVDDIAPGEDFVQTLDRQLQVVDAVLVMIGPRWLDPGDAARLHQAGDFVRREVETGLHSGKPVLPLLVGGARMPEQAALPPSLQALARRQALTLSDADWKQDVEALAQALSKLSPGAADEGASRRLVLALAGVAALLLLGVGSGLYLAHRAPDFAAVVGQWQASVKYEWGDTHAERFEFEVVNQRLSGTASYLSAPLPIEEAEFDGRHLRFLTRSQEMLGSDQPWKTVTHRYDGELVPDGIRFTLLSSGGYTLQRPLVFVAAANQR
jgi:hypothetical protein